MFIRRGSYFQIIGDHVNMAMRTLENWFLLLFFSHRHTPSLFFFFYDSRLPKAVFGQSFPFQRDIFNHNSRILYSMGTALNTVSLCNNRTDLTGPTSFNSSGLYTRTCTPVTLSSLLPHMYVPACIILCDIGLKSTSVFCP